MTGEELAGPAGPKMFRLMAFISAGVVCAFSINKYREWEDKKMISQKKIELNPQQPNTIPEAALKEFLSKDWGIDNYYEYFISLTALAITARLFEATMLSAASMGKSGVGWGCNILGSSW